MRGLGRLHPGLLAAAACVVFAGIAAAAGGADGTALRQHAAQIRSTNATLAQREHRALLDLYALEAKLTRAQARLVTLHNEAERVRAERASDRRQLRAALSTVLASQTQLALRLRTLYEQADVDPLAAVLGASSIDDAIASLDELDRSAKLNQRITRQAQRARTQLKRLAAALEARSKTLAALTAATQTTYAALAAQRAARGAFAARLREQQRLNSAQVTRLAARAATAAAKAPPVSPPARAAAPAPATPPASAGATLVVVATGYSLSGVTSSGMPAGWGVAAVDPSLIPLGTHISVPGYGDAVAADTGSGVSGAVIDLWFPSEEQALAWGRRTVSITLQ